MVFLVTALCNRTILLYRITATLGWISGQEHVEKKMDSAFKCILKGALSLYLATL